LQNLKLCDFVLLHLNFLPNKHTAVFSICILFFRLFIAPFSSQQKVRSYRYRSNFKWGFLLCVNLGFTSERRNNYCTVVSTSALPAKSRRKNYLTVIDWDLFLSEIKISYLFQTLVIANYAQLLGLLPCW
jgi:hypothetical protein